METNYALLILRWTTTFLLLCTCTSCTAEASDSGQQDNAESSPLFPSSAENVCHSERCQAAASMLLRYINFSIDPCDDFYSFACGRWITDNPIPPSSFVWSADDVLLREVERISLEILDAPVNPQDFKCVIQAKQYYSQCANKALLESRGLQPVLNILNTYGGWPAVTPDWNPANFNISLVIADANRIYTNFLMQEKEKTYLFVKIEVAEDLRDTDKLMIVLDQPGFSLPPSALLDQEDYGPRIDAFRTLFVSVAKAFIKLTGAHVTDLELSNQFSDVIAFEARLANVTSDEEIRNNLDRLYNRIRLSTFQSNIDKMSLTQSHARINWFVVFTQMFINSGVTVLPQDDLLVFETEYLADLVEILETTPARTVANYAMWRFAYGLIPYTTEEMRSLIFEYRKVAFGFEERTSEKDDCVAMVAEQGFGMAVGVKYIAKSFDAKAKIDVDQMVEIMRTAFDQLLDEAEWMDSDTKISAKIKIAAISKFMAYPEWLFNETKLGIEYENLEIADTFLESAIALSDWVSLKKLKTLRKPTDKAAWRIYPGVVNAHYNQETNSILFPAGSIAPPYYLREGPKFLNFGGIGAVIGHELTHALDIGGSQYDEKGNFNNWWSPTTLEFNEKAQCFVKQFDAFTTPVGSLNGNLTSSENIADNGGLREAHRAYKIWVQKNNKGKVEPRLPGLERFTPEQLFFTSFGISWCTSMTNEELANQLNGFHSPPQFRVLGAIQNSLDFGATFNCPVGSRMNPPVAQKCTLW